MSRYVTPRVREIFLDEETTILADSVYPSGSRVLNEGQENDGEYDFAEINAEWFD